MTYDQTIMGIVKDLSQARRDQEVSLEELAKAIGISAPTLAAYEAGKPVTRSTVLWKWARCLGLTFCTVTDEAIKSDRDRRISEPGNSAACADEA